MIGQNAPNCVHRMNRFVGVPLHGPVLIPADVATPDGVAAHRDRLAGDHDPRQSVGVPEIRFIVSAPNGRIRLRAGKAAPPPDDTVGTEHGADGLLVLDAVTVLHLDAGSAIGIHGVGRNEWPGGVNGLRLTIVRLEAANDPTALGDQIAQGILKVLHGVGVREIERAAGAFPPIAGQDVGDSAVDHLHKVIAGQRGGVVGGRAEVLIHAHVVVAVGVTLRIVGAGVDERREPADRLVPVGLQEGHHVAGRGKAVVVAAASAVNVGKRTVGAKLAGVPVEIIVRVLPRRIVDEDRPGDTVRAQCREHVADLTTAAPNVRTHPRQKRPRRRQQGPALVTGVAREHIRQVRTIDHVEFHSVGDVPAESAAHHVADDVAVRVLIAHVEPALVGRIQIEAIPQRAHEPGRDGIGVVEHSCGLTCRRS